MTIEACKKLVAAMLAFAWLLIACALVFGQDAIKIDGKVATVKVKEYIEVEVERVVAQDLPVKLTAPAGGLIYSWEWPEGWKVKRKANVLELVAAPKGQGTVAVEWPVIDFKAQTSVIKTATITFFVGDVPQPKPPTPPTPDPTPEPPIPVGALRVIFVRESADNLAGEQLHVWNSTQIAAYLNAKCIKDGNQPGWRKYDKDMSADKDTAGMKALWDSAKGKAVAMLPLAIIVAVGTQATVYDIKDQTETGVLAMLKKHAEGN